MQCLDLLICFVCDINRDNSHIPGDGILMNLQAIIF